MRKIKNYEIKNTNNTNNTINKNNDYKYDKIY